MVCEAVTIFHDPGAGSQIITISEWWWFPLLKTAIWRQDPVEAPAGLD
jgi:hypothetical protein